MKVLMYNESLNWLHKIIMFLEQISCTVATFKQLNTYLSMQDYTSWNRHLAAIMRACEATHRATTKC